MSDQKSSSGLLFRIAGGMTLLFLVFVTVFAYFHYQSAISRRDRAVRDLARCRQLCQSISSLQGQPVRAALPAEASVESIYEIIERAKKTAGLSDELVKRIDSQTAKRLNDSDYLDQNTEIEIEGVLLPQLIRFLLKITRNLPTATITKLRISAPKRDSASSIELWRVELVLTNYIFSPKSPSGTKRIRKPLGK